MKFVKKPDEMDKETLESYLKTSKEVMRKIEEALKLLDPFREYSTGFIVGLACSRHDSKEYFKSNILTYFDGYAVPLTSILVKLFDENKTLFLNVVEALSAANPDMLGVDISDDGIENEKKILS